jgi:hypothetical protein
VTLPLTSPEKPGGGSDTATWALKKTRWPTAATGIPAALTMAETVVVVASPWACVAGWTASG